MKRVVLLMVMLAMSFAGYVSAAEPAKSDHVKIAVVDLMKALNESTAGKKAKQDLEVLIKSKQSLLDDKGREIEKLKGEVEKQSSVLSADARKSKEEELEKLIRDYQRIVSDSQNDIKKKEAEFTGEIIKDLRAVIEKIASEGGYTMVIENAEGIILFSKKELDLTESVIKKYNESKEKTKK